MGVRLRIPTPVVRVFERTLYLVGTVLLCWVGWQIGAADWYQRVEGRRLDRTLVSAPAGSAGLAGTAEYRARAARAAGARHQAIGRLVIPRLGVSAVVAEGADDGTLAVAVGHLPDTAFPGERGNAVFAAHRDGLFRPLRQLRRGDLLEIRTADGRFRYRVDDFTIVAPEHVEVLAATRGATLTLVTCYPFDFIGPAPLRFVVRASLLPASVAVSTG